jgi:hypothetical protein
MEQEISKKLSELEAKIDGIFASVEKTRKYFLWTLIITIALFILPLLGLAFVIPSFVNTYTSNLQGLGV